jgi:hypothetical protein
MTRTTTRYAPIAMHRFATTLAIVMLVAACAPSEANAPVETATVPPPIETTATTAPPPTTTGAPADSPCLIGDRPFSSSGVISAFGSATGDAAQISEIRAGGHPGCERVVVDMLTADGAPAGSLGLVGVEYNEEVGIVRINLPAAITRTAIADTRFDGELAERAYVVRTADGHLAVDIHVVGGAAVALRAFEVDAPSRIVVDLRPDADATPVRGSTVGDGVVLTQPGPGPVAASLSVSGYARTFEGSVVVRLHGSRDGEPLTEMVTTATDWVEAWGEFEVMFPSIPRQPLELFVGTDSPRDGTPEGAWVTIDATVVDPVDSGEI